MITVKIDGDERPYESADPSWVRQHLRQADGKVCMVVRIDNPSVSVLLATPKCGMGGGGGGSLTPRQSEIVEEWRKRGLNDEVVSLGNVMSFLNQLKALTR